MCKSSQLNALCLSYYYTVISICEYVSNQFSRIEVTLVQKEDDRVSAVAILI